MQYLGLCHQYCACQHVTSAVFLTPTSQFMAPLDPDDSSEDFSPSPPDSSAEDGHEADIEFQPMPDTWMIEQLNILLLQVDDLKASKNVKSKN